MNWIQNAKLLATSTRNKDQFGYAVAASQNTLVVGAARETRDGKAHVFVWNGENWQEQAELIHTRTTTDDAFGHAVAIDGDTIVVGAPYENRKTGAAYIFQRHDTTWQQVAKLTPSDAQPGALFSYGSVSIDGDTIVIAAVDDRNRQGAVYIFHQDNQHWVEEAKLVDPQADKGYRFGYRVKIRGNTIVVGHDIRNLSQGIYGYGKVHLFQRENHHWRQQIVLYPGEPSNFFGHAVSISDNLVVVGAFYDDAAYLFSRQGENWIPKAILKGDPSPSPSWFGFDVFIDGEIVVVGAPYANESGQRSGAVYIYTYESGDWIRQGKIIGNDITATEEFGFSVTANQEMVIIGSVHNQARGHDTGAVYTFMPVTDNGVPFPEPNFLQQF
ncbi:MAG: FG-GAP repeat protein [Calothrix sp. MO_192.B10]|nr:FG-GAP repeat protein [Calothrix sp. MO_192.B10]